jgi:pimeloyl-ACP methyl ester carboxylesterase
VEIMKPALLGKTSLATRPELVASLSAEILTAKPNGVISSLRAMANRPDSTPLLKNIKVPVLVISGEEDPVIPSSEMEAMAKLLKEAEFHVLPKVGHVLNMEAPDLFKDKFSHFLKRRVL